MMYEREVESWWWNRWLDHYSCFWLVFFPLESCRWTPLRLPFFINSRSPSTRVTAFSPSQAAIQKTAKMCETSLNGSLMPTSWTAKQPFSQVRNWSSLSEGIKTRNWLQTNKKGGQERRRSFFGRLFTFFPAKWIMEPPHPWWGLHLSAADFPWYKKTKRPPSDTHI